MSRIIVKQLPKNITESKLRDIFGTKGAITDVQLKYTRDGVFRQFAYIGYHGENEAQTAVKFFNNSCIQANRIKVETCATLGGEEKPKSWSKYAKDSSKFEKNNKNNDENVTNSEKEKKSKTKKISKFEEIIGEHKDDPQFREFMSVHEKNRTLWSNDAETEQSVKNDLNPTTISEDKSAANNELSASEDADNGDTEEQTNNKEEDVKIAGKEISDLEYMKSLISHTNQADKKSSKLKEQTKQTKTKIDLFTIKIRNVPYEIKRQEIIKFFKPLKPFSVRLPTKTHGFCYAGFKSEKDMKKAMLKNKSFISGKQVIFYDFTEKNKVSKSKLIESNGGGGEGEKRKNSKWDKQISSLRGEEDISESGKIFFRNLAYTVTETDLQETFEKYGPIAEINLPVDNVTRQIKGFGTVTFVMPEHAVLAYNDLDGTCFHGRLLHLIPGKTKDVPNDEEEKETESSYKNKKSIELKKSAQQSHSWNTLFLGSNAVAEILSKNFDTTKETILDTSAGGTNAGVRIALGETQIVIEMKKFLEENGVCLSAFDGKPTKRSKTVILAKNLPAATTVADLTPLFAKFGPIGRLILPPSGVTALIEFCEPSEARQAFTKLAYTKFKNLPLFLEWAPENVFQVKSTEAKIPKIEKQEKEEEKNSEEKENETSNEDETKIKEKTQDECSPPEPNTTLFLRNLNFRTVKETVIDHFKHLGAIHHVEIAGRRDPENPKNKVSLGYGFIQFQKSETAEKALKQMQFTTIDEKQVELKRSDRTLRMDDKIAIRKGVSETKQTGTKILVRNIAFQAKPNEIRDIFKAFGTIRSVRLPLKMAPGSESHRGFGFVDFITKNDAKQAFEALSQSTHLYGRRLVLEWASKEENDIEELRKRTAEHFEQTNDNQTKQKRKANFDITEIDERNNNNDANEMVF